MKTARATNTVVKPRTKKEERKYTETRLEVKDCYEDQRMGNDYV